MRNFKKWLRDNCFTINKDYCKILRSMSFFKDGVEYTLSAKFSGSKVIYHNIFLGNEYRDGKLICSVCETQKDMIEKFSKYLNSKSA